MGRGKAIEELIKELKEERAAQREMLGAIIATSQAQTEAMTRVISVVEGMMKGFEVQGLPSSERHLSDDQHAQLIEEFYFGSDDAPDGAA